jgi:hypothetical protein
MRLLFAIALVVLALLLAALLFWVRPTWAEMTRGTTDEGQTLVVSFRSIDEHVTTDFGRACGRDR